VTRPSPKSHWLLLTALLVGVVVMLGVAAVTGGHRGEQPQHYKTDGTVDEVPEAVIEGGPILNGEAIDRRGARLPSKTVALTFDDGPDSDTERVLDVLERFHVPATFFVIGSRIPGHTDVLRRMVSGGDEIGVHTFTHPDLGAIPRWQRRLELDQTQFAIAAATGYLTHLMRPPFSSEIADINYPIWHSVSDIGPYLVVLADRDTKDWARPGVDKIVAAATPQGDDGAVVMFHDGGGDRSETVAALEKLIPQLQERGFQFTTISRAIGDQSPWIPATPGQRIRGAITLAVVQLSLWFALVLKVFFITAGVLALIRVGVLIAYARGHAKRAKSAVRQPDSLPGVTIVVPAFNECLGIEACVRSLTGLNYPEYEVIVVDDGSTDDTSDIVRSLDLDRVTLIRKENGGKPSALNAGIAAARYETLVLVDGDTVFRPNTLRELVKPFADPEVGAVSGNTKVANRDGLLGAWQHLEYVMGFNLDRRMFDVLECMPTVPGAIGAFRRAAVERVGGVSDDTLAEDTDLTMALCRDGWRVVYAPNAVAWTEAPATLTQLWRQRYRWCYGTLQSMWKHRHAVVERGQAGKLGRRGLPYLLLFQVLLPLTAPVVDVAAGFSFFTEDVVIIWGTWFGFLVAQLACATYAFRLDREPLRPLWTMPLQQIVYRQLMYLVVIQSVASAFYGVRLRWHAMRRLGTLTAPAH
jgi:cellulose synthase/poly-beta-1,6-N-acetylglucosamine synthase-like glycosyltransferase/peptidoglycan/xylan/chitin deacetylase (PgdA/CDA1 family)